MSTTIQIEPCLPSTAGTPKQIGDSALVSEANGALTQHVEQLVTRRTRFRHYALFDNGMCYRRMFYEPLLTLN